MPQSLAQVYLHLVFSTKNRTPFVEDHVHLLVRFGRTVTIANLIKELKRTSSIWIKDEFGINAFEWQSGYGAFSISPAHLQILVKYIKNQEEHHKKVSFQDEFRRLLKKYQIEYDERYVWD
jgi:putative transposase